MLSLDEVKEAAGACAILGCITPMKQARAHWSDPEEKRPYEVDTEAIKELARKASRVLSKVQRILEDPQLSFKF